MMKTGRQTNFPGSTGGGLGRPLSIFVILSILLMLSTFTGAQEQYGICTNMNTEAISNKVQELGVRWIRMTVSWDRSEPRKGTYDWRSPDEEIARAAARGLKIYITVERTPRWANGNKGTNTPPKDAQDWKDFLRALALHYKNQPAVKAYGMWNEPNLKEFWNSSQKHYIYTILIPGAIAIKTVDRNLIVAGPELSHHWIDQKDWELSEILKAGGSYLDVITQHYYPDSDEKFDHFLDHYMQRDRLGKSVWITEFGQVACKKTKCSETNQSRAYWKLLTIQQSRSAWITRIFPYRIWDPKDACGTGGNGFGLAYGDGVQERPAFGTYRDFIAGRPYRDPDPACSAK